MHNFFTDDVDHLQTSALFANKASRRSAIPQTGSPRLHTHYHGEHSEIVVFIRDSVSPRCCSTSYSLGDISSCTQSQLSGMRIFPSKTCRYMSNAAYPARSSRATTHASLPECPPLAALANPPVQREGRAAPALTSAEAECRPGCKLLLSRRRRTPACSESGHWAP